MPEPRSKTWELGYCDWEQDIANKRFNLTKLRDSAVAPNGPAEQLLDVVVGASIHPPGSCPSSGHFLPGTFSFCPNCRAVLPKAKPIGDSWIPPYGAGNGLKVTRDAILTDGHTFEVAHSFPPPRNQGDFQFIVSRLGTERSVLVGFDRKTGGISVFSPSQRKWVHLTADPGPGSMESTLPAWSWSPGLIENGSSSIGFAVPTDLAPMWAVLEWPRGAVKYVRGEGKCIGGVGVLGERAYVPTQGEGDSIALQAFDLKAGKWLGVASAVIRHADAIQSGDDLFLSVPVIDEGRQCIFWVGVHGLLKYSPNGDVATWHPWEDDAFPCRALPELGPPYRDSFGDYWQICFDRNESGYEVQEEFRYHKFMDDPNSFKSVASGHFSSGIACFCRYYDYWNRPWDKIDQLVVPKADTYRVPLLCLDESTQATVVVCFKAKRPLLEIIDDRNECYQTILQIERPDAAGKELPMACALNVPRPWELRVFVYLDELVVYSPDERTCLAWRLR